MFRQSQRAITPINTLPMVRTVVPPKKVNTVKKVVKNSFRQEKVKDLRGSSRMSTIEGKRIRDIASMRKSAGKKWRTVWRMSREEFFERGGE